MATIPTMWWAYGLAAGALTGVVGLLRWGQRPPSTVTPAPVGELRLNAALRDDHQVVFTWHDVSQSNGDENRTRFLVDTLVLRSSFEHVTASPDAAIFGGGASGFKEVFHYNAGLRVDTNIYVISHLIPVGMSEQSASYVRVADASNIGTLAALDEVGLPLVAHTHVHPGFGPGATKPSVIDYRFQERLERGGHCAIGLIFSRDGYCRFFAGDPNRFVVDVQGNYVEKVEDNVYKLSVEDGDFPFQRPQV